MQHNHHNYQKLEIVMQLPSSELLWLTFQIIDSVPYSLTHILTDSLTHSLTQWLIYWFTSSLYSVIHWFTYCLLTVIDVACRACRQPLAAYINDSELANLAASQSMTFSWTLQYRCIYIWDTKYMYISHVHFNVGRCRLAIHLTLPMRDSRIQDYQNYHIGRLYHIWFCR